MTKKAIVITGCSSGFGRYTALEMARRGWLVLATVRKDPDRSELLLAAERDHCQQNLAVFLCDITVPEQIATFALAVQAHLAAGNDTTSGSTQPTIDVLLNNAGTAYGGPLEMLPIDDLRAQFEINVFAHVAVTQAFLPMLKLSHGIIINVSSISGRIVSPAFGPYTASKFALEALSDTWRMELAPFGVRVVVIEPASSPTDIWNVSLQRAQSHFDETAKNGPYARLVTSVEKIARRSSKVGFPPQQFADLVVHIVTTPKPHTRYGVPGSANLLLLVRRFLPDRFWDWIIHIATGW